MNPIVQYYFLDLGILTGLLACIALICLAGFGSLGWLLSRQRGNALLRTLWLSIMPCIAAAVIAIPLFIGIAGLYRYDPPAGNFTGLAIQRQDWELYASAARFAFYALYGLLVVLSGAVGYLRARPKGRGKTGGIAAALAVLVYLVLTMPVVDFFNACTIGKSFFLRAGC